MAAAAASPSGLSRPGPAAVKRSWPWLLLPARRQPTLIVVHTKELLYQWQERVRSFLVSRPGWSVMANSILAPLTVAIVNSARKSSAELVPHFGHLVVDECHRVPANLFTDVVSHFDCHYLLGLSATAFRSDEQ